MSDEYSTVACAEEFGTAQETYDDERGLMSASVTLRVPYANRHDLASDILSNHRPWPKGSATLIPLAYGAAIVQAQNIPASYSAGSQIVNTLEALVTIHYSTKRVELITEEIEPTAEFVNLDYKKFRWGSGTGDALTPDEAPGFLVRGINFVRNEMFVNPTDISSDLYSLVGSVNIADFSSGLLPNFVAPAETLLFNPPVIHMKYNSVGDTQYDLTKRFTYKPQGWNKYYRQATQDWSYIYLYGASDPYKSYTPASFANILVVQDPYT